MANKNILQAASDVLVVEDATRLRQSMWLTICRLLGALRLTNQRMQQRLAYGGQANQEVVLPRIPETPDLILERNRRQKRI